ncbi:MAG: TIGR03790 family protein [Sedimentisphaerales bacterium]|nr:TIGR03790 family protein [Sedimentisphaerales bacterium]
MTGQTIITTLLMLISCRAGFAPEPDEILVIVNRQVSESKQIAEYYCRERNIPDKNIIHLALGHNPAGTISRDKYEQSIALPIRRHLQRRAPGEIKCLVTTYGIPISAGSQGPIPGMRRKINELKQLKDNEKQRLEQLKQNSALEPEQISILTKQTNQKISQIKTEIGRLSGHETHSSVDSELSMVLVESYDLYRWQPNMLNRKAAGIDFKTLMVSRLDGPDYKTIKGLIDKALIAEKTGLEGHAYIDSRGIVKKNTYGQYDQSLRNLEAFIRLNTKMPVTIEKSGQLFQPGSCPQTAVYCGWYSVKKYVDAFDFVDGAVGFHIASYEAQNLHDPNSTTWCAAMLRDGITATLGAVAEPYLHSFPEPKEFFAELFNGSCLAEAYYRTKPFNSWQLVLIGDPLYAPFKNSKN